MPGHDPLLHRPWPGRIILQKFFVVVCLDHKRVHFAQPFDQHLCRVTEISNEAKTAACRVKGVADRVNGIVRYCKGLDGDVADAELGPGPKNSPILVLSESGTADRFRRVCVAINRDGNFPAQHF